MNPPLVLSAAQVAVGAGSYTTRFPGVDVAGRNGFPSGTAQLSGAALGRPVPTNDWWSAAVKNDHAENLFNYPLGMRTLARGLDIGYVVPGSGPNGSVQPLSDQSPLVAGLSGLNAPRVTVDDYSDWTVSLRWATGAEWLQATAGVGMPFVYFRKSAGSEARVEVNMGTVTVQGARLLVTDSQSGGNFVVYGPAGTVWKREDKVYRSDLAGKDYWSIALLPPGVGAQAAADALAAHAHVHPTGTRVEWAYDAAASLMRVDYHIETVALEGDEQRIVQGLLPHQWHWLGAESAQPQGPTYFSMRGQLKALLGNHFYTERHFSGILPTLPFIPGGSETFSLSQLRARVDALKGESLATWTDSYNEGQVMNRLVQTARVAALMGDTAALDSMLTTVQRRLEDWFSADPGEVAFLFYYNENWSALIGYPAGHGQDSNLNDHHFHWGYFIHAAAFLEQYRPGWAAQWGPMVEELIRDCGNPSRDDPRYPFLRNFSPFAGHSWANGFATFPQGNDQESTSESMQFNSSLIHWGAVTGNDAIRDLGIYLYVTEQSAIEEYWFDIHRRNFRDEYGYSVASRVWGNGYDNGTFWTTDIAATYGIELYPIHGGSLYLGHPFAYAESLWTEMAANTGILANQPNVNLWHDVYWSYLAFTDPAKALELYAAFPERELKFGISDAQTYHWLHAMQALGPVRPDITADDPIAAVFGFGDDLTYVAHNYRPAPHVVTFSDGTTLQVPAASMATSRDVAMRGDLSVSFAAAAPGGSVDASLSVVGTAPDRVEFLLDDHVIATLDSAPWSVAITDLQPGVRDLYARIFVGERFAFSNALEIIVGEQTPYNGSPWPIPGTIDAAFFDRFAGSGQGISYFDATPGNSGTVRTDQAVDIELNATEGAVVGWTQEGEWLEFTVDVAASGIYAATFRYASGNAQQRGPIRLLFDGTPVAPSIALPATADWHVFSTSVPVEVALTEGVHTLRLLFEGGELNLARMEFSFLRAFAIERPLAVVGDTAFVRPPASSLQLDASASSAAAGRPLAFQWQQLYGPSIAAFSDATSPQPVVANLREGFYRFHLTVSDGEFADSAALDVVVSPLDAFPPQISLTAPSGALSEPLGKAIALAATASDLDGQVASVAFYIDSLRIGTAWGPPFAIDWTPAFEGDFTLSAIATDSSGLSTRSASQPISITPPLPCDGTVPSGDFSYVFSENADGSFSLTFVPEVPGMGSPTCLLYYSTTGAAPFPGYPASPNVPLRLNAAAGQTVFFYYTYSHPAGGERNTLDSIVAFTLGACGTPTPPLLSDVLAAWTAAFFHPDLRADPSAQSTTWGTNADPDADGLPNAIEFALGTDPWAANHSPLQILPAAAPSPARLQFPIRKDLPIDALQLQVSSNLRLWSNAPSPTTIHTTATHRLLELTLPTPNTFTRLLID